MPDETYDASRLASLVKVRRSAFADIFDRLAKRHNGRELKLIQVLVGPPPPGAPEFLRAFEEAISNGWVEELVRVLLAAGAVREPDKHSANEPAYIELQKVTRPLEGFLDLALDSAAAEKARRRVCQITVLDDKGQPSYGTGFLVGPQTVLTNCHVVSDLLAPDGTVIAGSSARLWVTFDLIGKAQPKAVNVADDWLVCASPPHSVEQPKTNNVFSRSFSPAGFEDALDFAVLRLQEAEGRERGYYTVASSREPTVKTRVIVYQHPSGGPLARTFGVATALWPHGVHTRLRHDANTVEGSSGGLILDNRFELVALHQAGIRFTDNSLINAAIPTCYIAEKGKKENKPFDNIVGLDPMWHIAATGAPVFDRTRFQHLLLRAVAGELKVLVVRGASQSGISFSHEIMKDRLGLTEHRIVEVSALELPSEAGALAKLLLQRCGADEPCIASLPRFDMSNTASDAWLRDVLFPDFLGKLLASAGPRTVWVAVDDLNKGVLPATGAVALIRMLLQATLVHVSLRVVLLGHDRLAAAMPSEKMSIDDVPPIGIQDVARTISMRACHVPGEDQNEAAIKARAGAVLATARAGDPPFLVALVNAYRTIVEQVPQQAA